MTANAPTRTPSASAAATSSDERADDGIDAIRADGGVVHLRSLAPTDAAAARALHARTCERSLYLRFFSSNRVTADAYIATLVSLNGGQHHGVGAWIGGELVGLASFERIDDAVAEIALIIDDTHHRQGIGTLLIEQLVAAARRVGVTRFRADVLAENDLMAEVLRNLGYEVTTTRDHATNDVVFDIADGAAAVIATEDRQRHADVATMAAVLAPRSIAVIDGSVTSGRLELLMDNIATAGFVGRVRLVDIDHELPAETRDDAPDLAIVLGAGTDALDDVRAAGTLGAKAVLLLGPGGPVAAATALRESVLAAAHQYGMRLLGPDSMGVLNSDPTVRLNATLAELPMLVGGLGLVARSGALGVSAVNAAASAGLGVSQFVALGESVDICEDDLMLTWMADPHTQVIGLLLDRLTDPERFATIAARVLSHTPILAYVQPDRFGLATRRSGSTAAAAVRDVLLRCGVQVCDSVQELIASATSVCRAPESGVDPGKLLGGPANERTAR